MILQSNDILTADGDSEGDLTAQDDTDRRRHARSVRVMRVARLMAPGLDTEGLGMVRDVSSGGMMIDAQFDIAIGQPISIALIDDHELTGTVVWQDGSLLGIGFAQPISVESILAKPAAEQDGRRARLPRFTISKPVELKTDAIRVEAVLHDISQRGAKLQCEGKFRVHTNLVLRTKTHRPVAGTIKWRASDMLGVEFHRLLPLDELDQWLKI
jgi:hypothetical protein